MYYVKLILRFNFLNRKKKNFIFNIRYLCRKFNIFYSENDAKKSHRQNI